MWLGSLYRRARALLRSESIHREIEEEMRFHVDMRAEENVRRGMSPGEARREAERRFGRLTRMKEQGYEVRGGRWLETFWRDCRYGARSLRKSPGFTAVAVLTLALGIGVNTAIFSVVNAVLINPLPYREADRIVQFWETNPLKNWTQATVAPANLFDWQEQSQSFTEVAAYMGSDKKGPGLSGLQFDAGGEPERLQGLYVTGNIFSVLGVGAVVGRTLTEEETWAGRDKVVVLSYGLWRRRFGADPKVVGRVITLDGVGREVVGVMPPGFYFPSKEAELWVPAGWNREKIAALRRPHFLRAVGRLKPGVTLEQAQAEMQTIAARLEAQHPDTNTQMGVGLGPLKEWIVSDVRLPLVVLLAAVAFVLLIACANVANLLLSRAAVRAREVAVRRALGAGRLRVVRQQLTESLLLALAGAGAGLLLAVWFKDLLVSLSPGDIPRLDELRLDWRVLCFTLAAALLTTLLTGLTPALQSIQTGLAPALKEGGQKGSTGQGRRVRGSLVIAEVSIALVLAAGAGLTVRSFLMLREVNPGFDPNNTLTLRVSLPQSSYKDEAKEQAFFARAEQVIKGLPGVAAVGSTTLPPLKGYRWTGDMTIEGRSPEDWVREIRHKEITPDYFRAMGLPLLKGRFFDGSDTDKGQPTTIVNNTFARRYFPGEDAVGKRVKFGKPDEGDPWETIVGVVGDEKQDSLSAEVKPEAYKSHLQSAQDEMTLVVRASGDPRALAGAVREQIRALDPSVPVYDVKTMQEIVYESLARERFIMLLMALFAALALALAAVGIYGVVSYATAQRTHEIGIRMALGAQARDVLKLMVRQGLSPVLAGVGLGLLAALALTRLMSSLLYGVSATDPLTFAAVALLLTAVSLLACYLPARRATRVDPLTALRYE
jgi:putative ABC transport system permease protein